jgi:hypothetical protein
MKANAHDKAIDEGYIQAAVTKLDELIKLFEAYITPLTPQERHDLPKMGPKTLEFVEKCYEFAEANPNLRPAYLNMNEFKIDFSDAHNLYLTVNKATQLLENLSDTQLAAGSEAYQSSLMFYNAVKNAAANDISGAKAVYEELRKRYPGKKRRRDTNDE